MFQYFAKLLESYTAHVFRAKWQSTQFNWLKQHLPPGQVICLHDFSENYTCKEKNRDPIKLLPKDRGDPTRFSPISACKVTDWRHRELEWWSSCHWRTILRNLSGPTAWSPLHPQCTVADLWLFTLDQLWGEHSSRVYRWLFNTV